MLTGHVQGIKQLEGTGAGHDGGRRCSPGTQSQGFPYSQPKMNMCTFLRQVSFHGDTTYFSLWKYRTGNEPGAQVTDASRSTEVRLRMLRSCSRRGWGRRRHFSSAHRGARDGTTRDGPRSGPQRVNHPPHHSDSSQI